MKKLIFGLIVALVLMGAIPAMADSGQTFDTYELSDKKYVITNNTSDHITTAIPTTVIKPLQHRILRITVGPTATSVYSENYAAIYDASSSNIVSWQGAKVCEGEIEADSNWKDAWLDYKRPLMIYNGVVIVQGPFSVVMIEWEYFRP